MHAPTDGGEMRAVVVSVPAMLDREDLRVISAQLCDLPGVAAVEVDLGARTVRVQGQVGVDEVCAAITEAGYEVDG